MKTFIAPKYVGTFAALVLLFLTIFVLRIGVADNGRLYETLETTGLYFTGEETSISSSDYFATTFGVMKDSGVPMSGNGPYMWAKIISWSRVNVMLPAFFMMAMFLAGFYLLLRNIAPEKNKNSWIIMAVAVFVFLDSARTAYFNTPYPEALMYIYLILLAGLFCQTVRKKGYIWLILFGLIGTMFAVTRLTAAYMSLFIGLFCLRFIVLRKDLLYRVVAVLVGGVIFASGVSTILTRTHPVDLYHSVFYGILNISENPTEDLKKLGLDEGLAVYAGRPHFEEDVQEFMQSEAFATEFLDKTTYKDVFLYYITHPGRYLKTLDSAARNSTTERIGYLGNFSASTGKAGQQSKFFTLFSYLKPKMILNMLAPTIILLLGYLILTYFIGRKKQTKTESKILAEGMLVLGVCAALEVKLSVPLYGMAQIAFNLFLYNAIFDLMIVFSVAGIIQYFSKRRQEFKEKFGANQ